MNACLFFGLWEMWVKILTWKSQRVSQDKGTVDFENSFIGSLPYLSYFYWLRFLFVRFKPFCFLPFNFATAGAISPNSKRSIVIQVGAQCGCQSSEAQHRCMAQKWSGTVHGLWSTNSRILGDIIFYDLRDEDTKEAKLSLLEHFSWFCIHYCWSQQTYVPYTPVRNHHVYTNRARCLGLRTEQDFLGKGHWEDGLLAAGKGFFERF